MLPKLLLGTAVSISLASPWLVSTQSDTSKHIAIQTESRGAIVGIVAMSDPDEQFAIQQEVNAYLAALERQRQIDEYLAALEAQRLAEEYARTHRTSSRAPALISSKSSGPHSDAWWWGVAICEQGGRNDPYFGYFSWMDGSAAGMTWEDQVAKSNALLASVSSESPAWAPSCVAAGYAASPGG